jgi:hypothetical protein
MAKRNDTNIARIKRGVIQKTKTSKTSGSQDTKGQSFYANAHLNHKASKGGVFEFAAPLYSANTAGTLDFNGQSSKSVFELYGRAEIDMAFSANNETFLSPNYVSMNHDIYKIPYTDVLKFRQTQDQANYLTVKQQIESPFISFTATTATTVALSSSTNIAVYTFSPEQIDKPLRGRSEEIFEDKAMYFFNTKHAFTQTLNTYQNTIGLDERKQNYVRQPLLETFGDENVIESGAWSGLTARGVFFTCLYPPSVPKIEDPRPESYSGETFTPEFYFSNVSDGDEYVIEITYQDLNNNFTIASATSQYFYSKVETENSTRRVANVEKTSFISETTRRASVPLVPGSTYYYRIGNVKSIVNLFGVKQSIISYTESTQGEVYSGQSISYIVDSGGSKLPPYISDGGSGNQTGDYQGETPDR